MDKVGNTPLTITFVLPFAGTSGGIRVVATYAQRLAARGHRVHVVSRPERQNTILSQSLRWLKGKHNRVRSRPVTPLLEAPGITHTVLDKRRPVCDSDLPDGDAVFATWWDTAAPVASLSAEKGHKFYLVQDYEVFREDMRVGVAESYHLPLKKLAVSQYIRDTVAKGHGISDIDIVLNAVDSRQFRTPPRQRTPGFSVGFLYSKASRKRSWLALAALEIARSKHPDMSVLSFGRGQPSEKDGLPHWVDYHLHPSQDKIPGLYAACDLWLFTSLDEGFGLPILEAMACRTPVLATWAGAAPDLINDTNGRLLSRGDDSPERIAEEILRVADLAPSDWEILSRHACRTAQAHDWEHATDRLLSHILAAKSAPLELIRDKP